MTVRRHIGIIAIGLLIAACSGAGATSSPSVKPSEALAAPSSTATTKPTQAPDTPAPTGSFHLEKTCAGFECTVTMSSLDAIPIGTKITYAGPGMNKLTATIKVEGGNATAACNIIKYPGECIFAPGVGTLAKMPSKVAVIQSGATWYWDGDLLP